MWVFMNKVIKLYIRVRWKLYKNYRLVFFMIGDINNFNRIW